MVTGASSGIGREFCLQLGAAGMNLVLVARREERLNELAHDLAGEHRMQTLVLSVDLSRSETAAEIQARVAAKGIKVRLLVNNAASGRRGRFEKTPPEAYQEMIQVNTAALVALCHRFLPDLTSFPTSGIINIYSRAALQPVPYMAVYAATKAFVHSFNQALYGEWKERGVTGPSAGAGTHPHRIRYQGRGL